MAGDRISVKSLDGHLNQGLGPGLETPRKRVGLCAGLGTVQALDGTIQQMPKQNTSRIEIGLLIERGPAANLWGRIG
jgi:hypothetical protein